MGIKLPERLHLIPYSNRETTLMASRLRIDTKEEFQSNKNSTEGVANQAVRLEQGGGFTQQERMIKDKYRSLQRALDYSYQAAKIIKAEQDSQSPIKALITPNRLKPDYDDKVISVGFEHNFKCGDIFEWIGTNTYWIIYLQDLTELAYFRGDVRKCSYKISYEDEKGEQHYTYAAIKGPSEKNIKSITKLEDSIDVPNYTLQLLIPSNSDTIKYFKRYTKFYLSGIDTCWRITATDSISTPGIIEVYAMEHYANIQEDDRENGIVGGLIEESQSPNTPEEDNIIDGPVFIKPKRTYTYKLRKRIPGVWCIDDKKYPVDFKVDARDPYIIYIKWNVSYSGQFDLFYGDLSKTVVVESLY